MAQPMNQFQEKEEETEPVDELEEPNTQQAAVHRGVRPSRETFKARGSLISRIGDDVAIPSHSKAPTLRSRVDAAKARKKLAFLEKKVAVDVFIPSTVSVGTLARLLNVRLGT